MSTFQTTVSSSEKLPTFKSRKVPAAKKTPSVEPLHSDDGSCNIGFELHKHSNVLASLSSVSCNPLVLIPTSLFIRAKSIKRANLLAAALACELELDIEVYMKWLLSLKRTFDQQPIFSSRSTFFTRFYISFVEFYELSLSRACPLHSMPFRGLKWTEDRKLTAEWDPCHFTVRGYVRNS
jgi:hypothetical protein